MNKISISIIIPIYNEEKTIEEVIKEIKYHMPLVQIPYEILVVNDGSTDNTAEILKNIKGITVKTHPYNKGYGASLKTAIEAATFNTIVMVDSDGTYPIEDILKLLEHADDYDLVSGVRPKKSIPFMRRFAKFFLSKAANFLAGQRIPDLNCGMRVIKKDKIQKFFHILPQRFSFTITHLLACLTNNHNVMFVPISYKKRKGKSSIHPIKDFIRFFNIIIRVITYFNPFKFFFLLSGIMLFFALVVYLYSFFVLHKLMDVAVIILVVAALQIFLFGLIADLIVKSRLK